MNKMIFKKICFCLLIIIFTMVIISCGDDDKNDVIPPENTKDYRPTSLENVDNIVMDELEAGFKFFYYTANSDLTSPGYGLIPDRYNTVTNTGGAQASIASVGYGLSSIPIGVEYGWITKAEGEERAYYTLQTLLNLKRTHGFFYHFVNMKTGLREWNSEVSIIDTAICVNGALIVGQYYGGRVEKAARELYESVEWNWYYDKNANKFYMGYTPENGFSGYWNEYAEQLMVYVLAAGSPKYSVGKSAYTLMRTLSTKATATSNYGSFYMTYTGSLFVYQFSHAWIDFRDIVDETGVNWFTNSVNATKASISYAISRSSDYKTYSAVSWGATACDGPNGYKGSYGSGPSSGSAHFSDGTIPPCGAIGSIVFTPEESIAAMKNYQTNEYLWSKYGFKDAYNLGTQPGYTDDTIKIGNLGWYGNDIIGIDKGISVLMIENYISGMIWNIFMDVDYVQTGLDKLSFTKV